MFPYDGLLMPVRMWPSARRAGSRLRIQTPQLGRLGPLPEHDAHLAVRIRPRDGARRPRRNRLTVAPARPHDAWWLVVGTLIGALLAVTLLVLRAAMPNLGVSD